MSESMRQLLKQNPEYRGKLYIRGFVLTDGDINENDYPFQGEWIKRSFARGTLLVHPQQHSYVCEYESITMALVGHAYNPFVMEKDEAKIVEELSAVFLEDEQRFWDKFNELTGVFTLIWFVNDCVYIVGDPSGMQTTFYTEKGGKIYISSHTVLLGELLGLDKDEYIQRLVHYRFFRLLGNSLPGDLTQFVGLRRLVPNHVCCYQNGKFINKRFFWPAETTEKSYETIVREASDILYRSMQLISEKWEHPAISLTGGCDSKTTLACANGLYDKFQYFSYVSSESEQVDADAAHEICKALHLQHKVYHIPEIMGNQDHYELVQKLLRWNNGDLIDSNLNDVRKRIVLDQIDDFDIEVKSWVSEIGRAYYSKRFAGKTKFPAEPSGRACTTLYKFFLHDRKLVSDTDRVFENYLTEFYEPARVKPVAWQEQFFWEFRVPSWNGLVITGEHRYSSDITIPYNNRKLLMLLLSVPLDKRIDDQLYTDIRARMNPKIDQTGISVTNLKHTESRAKLENLYWALHSKFPL